MEIAFAMLVSALLVYCMLAAVSTQDKEIKQQIDRNRRPWE